MSKDLSNLKAKQKEQTKIISPSEFNGWQGRLVRNQKTQQVQYTYQNVKLIFDNDENLNDIFAFDLFKNIEVLNRKPVWNRPTFQGSEKAIPFTDDDETQVRNYIRAKYNMQGDKTKLFADVIKEKCLERAYNPVTDYLNACKADWDKKPRIDTVLTEYLGVDNTELMRESFKTMLVGSVARAFKPACKFDYMAILTGSQGIGKSTLLARLGGDWYTDSLQGYNSKDDVQLTLGFWLIEDAELSAMKSSRIDTVKKFITKVIDSIRLPYGHRVTDYARRFTLWGTTNQSTFLYDKTGSRRFLVFKCNRTKRTKNVIDDLTPDEVAQIWGEAVSLYDNGFPLRLTDDQEQGMEQIRTEYQSVDEVAELVMEYLEILLPVEWYTLPNYEKRTYILNALENEPTQYVGVNKRLKVTVKEIMVELFKRDFKDSQDNNYKRQSNEVRDVMKSHDDWEYSRAIKINNRTTTGFKRK